MPKVKLVILSVCAGDLSRVYSLAPCVLEAPVLGIITLDDYVVRCNGQPWTEEAALKSLCAVRAVAAVTGEEVPEDFFFYLLWAKIVSFFFFWPFASVHRPHHGCSSTVSCSYNLHLSHWGVRDSKSHLPVVPKLSQLIVRRMSELTLLRQRWRCSLSSRRLRGWFQVMLFWPESF